MDRISLKGYWWEEWCSSNVTEAFERQGFVRIRRGAIVSFVTLKIDSTSYLTFPHTWLCSPSGWYLLISSRCLFSCVFALSTGACVYLSQSFNVKDLYNCHVECWFYPLACVGSLCSFRLTINSMPKEENWLSLICHPPGSHSRLKRIDFRCAPVTRSSDYYYLSHSPECCVTLP